MPESVVNDTIELLKWPELAAMLGLTPSGVMEYHRSGRLGPLPIHLGKRCVRFRRREIVAWIEAGCPSRAKWQAMRPAGGR